MNIIIILIFCFSFGVVPIYLSLNKVYPQLRNKIIYAIGFAPILLALLHISTIFLQIENSILRYLVLVIPYVFCIKSITKVKVKRFQIFVLLISVLFGLLYGAYAFPDAFTVTQKPYADAEFNLGIIQELKNNFLPNNPYWRTDNKLVYHFLGNIFYAAISSFTNIDVLDVYNSGNVVLAIMLFTIIGCMGSRNKYISNLVIAFLFLTIFYHSDWVLTKSFYAHLSISASTFYWALPTFISAILILKNINLFRSRIGIWSLSLIYLIVAFSIVFYKSTLIIPLLLLEFINFIQFIVKHRIFSFLKISQHLKGLLKFVFLPVFSIIAIYFLAKGSGGQMFYGIESRDFTFFNSWSLFYPLSLVFLAPLIYLGFNFKNRKLNFKYIVVAFINLILYFVIVHEGSSDVYFGFNALLLILIYFVLTDVNLKFTKTLFSFILSIILFYSVLRPNSKFLNPLDKLSDKIEYYQIEHDSSFYLKVESYKKYTHLFDDETLFLVDSVAAKDFSIPAYLGVSTWNGCNSYTHSTINDYTVIRDFLGEQNFIPNYVKEVPGANDYNDALNNYKKSYIHDSLVYEPTSIRRNIYNNLVFSETDIISDKKFLNENKITHIMVKASKLDSVANWIKNLNQISMPDYIVYCLE